MIKLASERNQVCLENSNLAIGYLLAGFPDREGFLDVLSGCETAGLDIFEIGYPSEDPSSDGEIIREAHKCVDHSIKTDLDYWKIIRAAVQAPIWIMAYQKDLIDTGFYKQLVEDKLTDALVIPDLSFEQRLKLQEEVRPLGVDVLGFVTPDMEIEEQEACFQAFPLIYQQLYSGPTGMSVATTGYEQILARAKNHESIRVFAGFGIRSAERAEHLLEDGFDGVIIGTAMISKLNTSIEVLTTFVKELKDTINKGR